MTANSQTRKSAVSELKRNLILQAAREIFEAEGLEGASLRSIAARAGYTPAALYFHFNSKEAIYADLLSQSLIALNGAVQRALAAAGTPEARFRATARAWYGYYAANPGDLELGFYLFRSGLKPQGLGRDRDIALNAALIQSLTPLEQAARDLGADDDSARHAMASTFAYATGLLTLTSTGRIRLLKVSPDKMMADFVETALANLR